MGSFYSIQEPPSENVPSAFTLTEVPNGQKPLHQVILLGYDLNHMRDTDYVLKYITIYHYISYKQ